MIFLKEKMLPDCDTVNSAQETVKSEEGKKKP